MTYRKIFIVGQSQRGWMGLQNRIETKPNVNSLNCRERIKSQLWYYRGTLHATAL